MGPFVTQIQVQADDIDMLGHVNNAVYQRYLEKAAIAHSAALGLTLQRYRELGGIFVMRRIAIDYLRPAVAGNHLEVKTWLETLRGPRAVRRYEIRRQDADDLLVTAEALWIWVNGATQRPQAMPAEVLAAFASVVSQP